MRGYRTILIILFVFIIPIISSELNIEFNDDDIPKVILGEELVTGGNITTVNNYYNVTGGNGTVDYTNLALTNQSNDFGSFNQTTTGWFNGKFNWSYIQNVPSFLTGNPFDQTLNTTSDVSFASAIVDNLVAVDYLDTPLVLFSSTNYYDNIILSYITGDSNERFRIKADGNISWSDGTNDYDTFLWRSGVNELSIGNLIVDGTDVGTWLYNQSLATFNMWNSTWDNSWVNTFSYNHTSETFNLYNSTWDNSWLINSSFNQALTDTLYSDIKWSYNFTSETFNLYNTSWDNRGLINSINITLKTEIDTKLNITDQRYNETAWVQAQNYLTEIQDNSTQLSYQNITDIPTCSSGQHLYFDGTTLTCTADTGGTGTFDEDAYYNKTDYTNNDIGWMAVNKTQSGTKTTLTQRY